jgi:hypothetical protein
VITYTSALAAFLAAGRLSASREFSRELPSGRAARTRKDPNPGAGRQPSTNLFADIPDAVLEMVEA